MLPIWVQICSSSKMTAGQDETYADVNKASSGAIDVRDRLKDLTHEFVRTQYDGDFLRHVEQNCSSCSSHLLCARSSSA